MSGLGFAPHQLNTNALASGNSLQFIARPDTVLIGAMALGTVNCSLEVTLGISLLYQGLNPYCNKKPVLVGALRWQESEPEAVAGQQLTLAAKHEIIAEHGFKEHHE